MLEKIKGAPIKEKIREEIISDTEKLAEIGVVPKLATLRMGEDEGEKYYEGAIIKNAQGYGFEIETIVVGEGEDCGDDLKEKMTALNEDKDVHGIMMLMPFPDKAVEKELLGMLDPRKDIDAVTESSYAKLFSNDKDAFYACTAESCMEILKYYVGDIKGKKVTVVGRSLRVGKPLLLMLMNANATVTVCHTRTTQEDLLKACREADIVVLATGQTESFDSGFFRDGQVIVDVGTGTGKDGKIAGDLNIKEIEESGKFSDLRYTPVPGGVGTVTTTLLLRNVIKAAKKANEDMLK